MSVITDNVLCEKFEANIFAKSRCQNCFRTVTAHQQVNQKSEDYEVKTPTFADGIKESDPCDPVCILVPQCELYVCLGSEDKTESWQESLEYTQLSSIADEDIKEAATCAATNVIPNTDAETHDTLNGDWEMTRLLDSILESDKKDTMYYAGQKQEARPESLHSDRARWAETASPGRTESWSYMEAEPRATMIQDHRDSRKKHQAESGYFSLERRKSEPNWASSPRAGCGTLPARGDASGPGRWPASSISSADSDLSWRTSGSSEGRHGLMRQEYTVLADLPKAKRLDHRQAFEKDRRSSRTRSPGREEVERIFGHERRKTETLEAFQALEEGLLERLDSKTLKLAKEGRLVRRQSSPTLRREVTKRGPWEPQQPSRSRGESQRSGRSEQRPERSSRSQTDFAHSGSLTRHLERDGKSKGVPIHLATPPRQAPREQRKWEEPMYHLADSRAKGSPVSTSHGKQVDSNRKSHLESLPHHKSPGKNSETRWKSCVEALHTSRPGRLDKAQASQIRQQERYKESDRKARGKPLLPIDTGEQPKRDPRDCQGATGHLSPGRGTSSRGQGEQSRSPPRSRECSWGGQGEIRRSLSPGKDMGIGLKAHRESRGMSSLGRHADRSQRENRCSLSPNRYRENSQKSSEDARCSSSPRRSTEGSHACPRQMRCCAPSETCLVDNWKSPRESPTRPSVRTSTESNSSREPSNPFASMKENDWKSCCKSLCSDSHPVTEEKDISQGDYTCTAGPDKGQEGSLCHVHPMQLLEREWLSQREHLCSTKPGQQQQCLEGSWRNQESPTGWIEDEWKSQERCPRPLRMEKQLANNWCNEENLLSQGDGEQLQSACPPRSQDLCLDAAKKHKPDLLNFKKGWMSILDKPGEWTKHWFVLTDSSLRYYRDSNAEEADDLDGEIDLRSCTDVTEYAVQRNYGFQIHTKDGVFTLSAMTSGIRRNWIEALRKSIRPASVPDVTKLSDSNKENSFRSSYGSSKSSFRSEEQRPSTGSEVITKGVGGGRRTDGQRHAFDYVELSPLQQGPLNQGSPQRTRGSARTADGAAKREELERDLAIRSEERRKWFESPASGVLQPDGPAGDHSRKAMGQEPLGSPLSEAQRNRLNEEIEKKWQELERLPLKESRRVPLMALLNQGKGGHQDASEALEKEVQVLRSQLESLRAQSEAKSHRDGQVPRGYISQEACERSLAEMETSHQQVMAELQRHHQREIERLQQEKERLLTEEAAATAAAIEALKKAHREELNKELVRMRSFQKGGLDTNALQQQHQSDVESLKRELQVLSEQYSQKCLEIGDLVHRAEEQEQLLQNCQQEGKELLRQNQELQRRLSEEIGELRSFITAQCSRNGASHNSERNLCELEVLLRVKENELQYLKREVQCLREELQMMQKDKRFASEKYEDVYVELNHIKLRSEQEIEQLKEHLRLAMAALKEKELRHNSIG